MHRLLARQLYKLGLLPETPPDPPSWATLLARISQAYHDADQERYTMERSLAVSSEEMQLLYQRQKTSYEARLRAFVGALPDLLVLEDEDGRCLEVLAAPGNLLNRPVQELQGKMITDVYPAPIAELLVSTIKKAIADGALQVIEYQTDIADGSIWLEARVMPTELVVNGKKTVAFLARDITELKRSSEELRHAATHDRLTGVPNRALFEDRLNQAISRAVRAKQTGAILFLDLDRFKTINDTLGHFVGDEMLKETTRRLQHIFRLEDTIARFGGDEFAILIEDIQSEADLLNIADKVLRSFAEPFMLQDQDLVITPSIGITLFPSHGVDFRELIKQADATMYSAKSDGRNRYQIYSDKIKQRGQTEFSIERRLRQAISEKQFFVEYQPQFRLSDGTLAGLEALLRWRHPELGLVSPADFIPVAELTGLIEEIGLWVFEDVCRQAYQWDQQQLSYGRLAINISRHQLMRGDFVRRIAAIIERTGVHASRLECEITESAVIEEASVASQNLLALSRLGLRLAIDDFGTGHASLANLKRFPLDRLKIDRSFIRDVGKDPNDEAIVKATIDLAHGLGLDVVAEGVENEVQLVFLRDKGCDEVQGFLLGRPMPVEAASTLLKKNPPAIDGGEARFSQSRTSSH